ncbi:MAG: TM2 domain-containing protein [Planifilum sp.]|jgi:TM2 domain-containing membrane protein YozV
MSNLSLKQQLSQEQLAVVQSEMELKKKSMVVAYLFAFFLGIFGAHRFYVGKTGTAVAQLVLTLLGIITMFIYVGFLLIWIVGIWVFIDYFLLYGYVKRLNEDIEKEIIAQVMRQSA